MHPIESPESRAPHFAPISEGPSTRLKLVAGYFTASAALTLVWLAIALATAASGRLPGLRAALRAHPAGPVLRLVSVGILFGVGALLRRRSRMGGALALLLFLLPLVARVFGLPVATSALVVAAVGALLVLTIWSELDAGSGRRTHSSNES